MGIDLAWLSDKNSSAIAIGELTGKSFKINTVYQAVHSLDEIIEVIDNQANLVGIAIDGPLIINNNSGQRSCETALSKDYSRRKSSCHASNKTLYPNACSTRLSNYIYQQGFSHLDVGKTGQWQIEVYPHPAIIEIFELKERLLYKKGKVAEKKQGQVKLSSLIQSLKNSKILSLEINPQLAPLLSTSVILSNVGKKIKQHEDALDSIICAYIGALFAIACKSTVYGDTDNGYIYVPTPNN